MLVFILAKSNFTAIPFYTRRAGQRAVFKYNTTFHTHDYTKYKYSEVFIFNIMPETENFKQQQNTPYGQKLDA